MSLCDRCYAPGYCCRNLWTTFRAPLYDDELPTVAEAQTMLRIAAADPVNVMPWVVQEVVRFKGDGGISVRCSCPALLSSGRCGVYERRPDACRLYEPLEDGLCVHTGGAEAGADPR